MLGLSNGLFYFASQSANVLVSFRAGTTFFRVVFRAFAWFSRVRDIFRNCNLRGKDQSAASKSGHTEEKRRRAASGEDGSTDFLERGSPSHLSFSPVLRNSPKQPFDTEL